MFDKSELKISRLITDRAPQVAHLIPGDGNRSIPFFLVPPSPHPSLAHPLTLLQQMSSKAIGDIFAFTGSSLIEMWLD